MSSEAGTYSLKLTVIFSSAVSYSSEIELRIYESGLPFFKKSLRKVQIYELYKG